MKNKGFTLIELLVVIAIIGILASLTIANYNGAQGRARDAQRKNDLKIVRDALEQFRIDTNVYPNATSGTHPVNNSNTGTNFTNLMNGHLTTGTTPYMRTAVRDPRNTGVFVYGYAFTGGGSAYTLTACFEDNNDTQGTWTNGSCGSNGTAGNGNRTYTVVNP